LCEKKKFAADAKKLKNATKKIMKIYLQDERKTRTKRKAQRKNAAPHTYAGTAFQRKEKSNIYNKV
jgi:hypothetical protein